MSNWTIPIVLLTTIALLGAAFIGHLADYNVHEHEHAHPQSIVHGDKVCVEGGGLFPNGMPGPQPFLVCGIIDHFVPSVPAPPEYPEGNHNLENESQRTA